MIHDSKLLRTAPQFETGLFSNKKVFERQLIADAGIECRENVGRDEDPRYNTNRTQMITAGPARLHSASSENLSQDYKLFIDDKNIFQVKLT